MTGKDVRMTRKEARMMREKQKRQGKRGAEISHEYASAVQSGRSMVETLGVLAIVGVLSVAAVAGMMIARDKMKANQIIAVGRILRFGMA